MRDQAALIGEILAIMRNHWDLPSDCNEGELFAYAEELLDRIRRNDARELLQTFLAEVQTEKLNMPDSGAHREIVDRSIALVQRAA